MCVSVNDILIVFSLTRRAAFRVHTQSKNKIKDDEIKRNPKEGERCFEGWRSRREEERARERTKDVQDSFKDR